MTPTRFQDDNTKIAYSGAWLETTGGYSGGTLAYARGAGTEARIAFTGTSVDLVALVGRCYGTAEVVLDGGAPEAVSLYSPAYTAKQTVWTRKGLENTSHTLVIRWTGTKGAGGGDWISLDALDIAGTLEQAE